MVFVMHVVCFLLKVVLWGLEYDTLRMEGASCYLYAMAL